MHFLFPWNLWQQLLDIHTYTLWPSITHCFYSARPTQQSNSCSVVETLIKSLFVFSILQQLPWVSLYILPLWVYLQGVRAGTGWDLPSQGEIQWLWQPGLCCQHNSQIWEMGNISWPAVSSFLPTTMLCGKEEGAEPCPCWTRAGGTAGDINRRESVDHSFLLTWLQSLSSCTEGLKNGDKLFRKG